MNKISLFHVFDNSSKSSGSGSFIDSEFSYYNSISIHNGKSLPKSPMIL